jgi:hypothetical protein
MRGFAAGAVRSQAVSTQSSTPLQLIPFQGLLHAPPQLLVDQVNPAGSNAYYDVELIWLHR